ncbi:MAG TPA: hypothetical protein DCE42_23515 [Myxococcales bacterium]|nr:hypothetical protein [Myxococcales bacterium]
MSKQIKSACYSAIAIGAMCTMAWWASAPLHTSVDAATGVKYVQLYNATPSPSWSPNGKFLAFHDLRFPKRGTKLLLKPSPTSYVRYLKRSSPGGYKRFVARYRARILRQSSPSLKFLGDSHRYSHVSVLNVGNMKRSWLAMKKLKSTTPSSTAYFHPKWANDNLLVTGSSFGNKGGLFIFPNGPKKQLPGLSVPTFGQSGRLIIGRQHQTGVFIAHVDAPDTFYAVVDERTKIRGIFPSFSPDGKKLAWIDAGTYYNAAPLKVFSVPFKAENLKSQATIWAKDPWIYRRKKHKALRVNTLKTPKTKRVVEFVWAQDSSTIAYVKGTRYRGYSNYQYGPRGLYLFKLGDKTSRLIDEKGKNPSFAPNGDVYYDRNNDGIWRWDAKTGKSAQLLKKGEEPRVSPDGKHLAFLLWKPKRRRYRSKLYLGIKTLK